MSRRIQSVRNRLAYAIALLLLPFAVTAQEDSPNGEEETAQRGLNLDEVVVTANALPISKIRSSASVSTVGFEAVEQSAPRSSATFRAFAPNPPAAKATPTSRCVACRSRRAVRSSCNCRKTVYR